ncbi:RNA-guided endonuclease TnpB family protein [Paenisporosarcina sp. TG20]|uniref:RNA-guided endonuclease TnpB family protein n=1 Tax=Paenisporosarcina sp. TG20 TaxID=1211706 RepID=UPI0002DA1FA0|nr:RNA-guided endonuclease TnpB family protein [Paenisporosarcina sp. TG20]
MAKRTNDLPKKAYKFRVFDHTAPKPFFAQSFGCTRWTFNQALGYVNHAWEKTGSFPTKNEVVKQIPQWKVAFSFLEEVDSIILQKAVEDLFEGFDCFKKTKGKQMKKSFIKQVKMIPSLSPKVWDFKGYPRFKSKRHSKKSFTTKMTNENIKLVQIDNKHYVKLPKCNHLIRFKKTREIEGDIKTVQVETDNLGKTYITFTCELLSSKIVPKATNDALGIDVGLTSLITDSNGNHLPVPVRYSSYKKRLTFLQRKFSRQQKGSSSREKTRRKMAKLHQKIYNTRLDHLHKLTYRLVRDNQTIAMEDLDVKQMLEARKYSNSIAHASWGKLKELLTYKCKSYGRTLIKVDRYFPSTQMCSACSDINPALKGNTTIRKWTCSTCSASHDRDHNAAINILNEAKKMVSAT